MNRRWKKFKLIIQVIEVRLRFIVVLVATGLLIGYWDTIKNYWEKYTRPAGVAAGQLPADKEFFCPMHPKVIRDRLEPDGPRPQVSHLRHAAVAADQGPGGAAAGGRDGPGAALARSHRHGRHRDRRGPVPAAEQADQHRGDGRLR